MLLVQPVRSWLCEEKTGPRKFVMEYGRYMASHLKLFIYNFET